MLKGSVPSYLINEFIFATNDSIREKLPQTEDKSLKLFLADKLIVFTSNEIRAGYIVNWLLGNNEDFGDIVPNITQTWKIVEIMCAYPDTFSERVQEALDIAKSKDNTSSKLIYTLKIEAITADDTQREELIKKYMSQSHGWSVEELTSSMDGFTSRYISLSRKQKYYEYFFDHLLDVLRSSSMTYSSVKRNIKLDHL